jgi:hypothetical protein
VHDAEAEALSLGEGNPKVESHTDELGVWPAGFKSLRTRHQLRASPTVLRYELSASSGAG